MCPEICTSLGEGAESGPHLGGDRERVPAVAAVCPGGRRGLQGWTPVGGGCQAAAWERGGMEAPYSGAQSWYKWLVRSGLSGLSKLTCVSTCLGLRVLDTCTLWNVPFPWSQRNSGAAGKQFP